MSVNDLRTFDLVLRTKFTTLSSAEAKSWLAGRCDQDAMPFVSTIEAQEESSRPHIGPDHPCARAAHALNELLQVGASLSDFTEDGKAADEEDVAFAKQAGAMILEKCGFAMERLSDALALLEHNERTLEYLREENLRDKSEALESYTKLFLDHEATKRLFIRVEEWNTQLVGQMAAARAVLDPRKRRPRDVAPDAASSALTRGQAVLTAIAPRGVDPEPQSLRMAP